ncbi:Lrp/AsnC family transcriptional regulator [Novosphingobium guangzhouense]|uniref:AsnC family transcriptional regulator n=1 Tax=Novosphingobium guangzhouense TaxID=1850347 RepID=A0A2K2G762_9SPHN|nr:Lrp/AsnC family transcriptional regulator [Novosphingobium guangzhouense]PNU06860.1 AsnC family transcriptional regulator [Novosphingobium guangzhouense]
MTELDSLDRRLISLLREDGRASVSKLAQTLGVSRATVQSRLDRLVKSGTILGFTLRTHGNTEKRIRAIALIEVEGHSTAAVIRSMRGIPETRSLHTTNGAWDLIAEIEAGDLPEFDRILRELRSIEGVLNSETSILLQSLC